MNNCKRLGNFSIYVPGSPLSGFAELDADCTHSVADRTWTASHNHLLTSIIESESHCA